MRASAVVDVVEGRHDVQLSALVDDQTEPRQSLNPAYPVQIGPLRKASSRDTPMPGLDDRRRAWPEVVGDVKKKAGHSTLRFVGAVRWWRLYPGPVKPIVAGHRCHPVMIWSS